MGGDWNVREAPSILSSWVSGQDARSTGCGHLARMAHARRMERAPCAAHSYPIIAFPLLGDCDHRTALEILHLEKLLKDVIIASRLHFFHPPFYRNQKKAQPNDVPNRMTLTISGAQFAFIFAGVWVIAAIFSAHHTWWKLPKPWEKGWARVLVYHHVSASLPPSAMNTLPRSFERQIRWLKRRRAIFCTLSELVVRMNRNEEGRFVAITLDDGYVDNYSEAFRIVQKHEAKMTVFLNPGMHGSELLDAGQIQTMQCSGCVEFGAHTLTHPDLGVATNDCVSG